MAKCRAVFFDLDGTLWDTAACHASAMEVVLEELEGTPLADRPAGEVKANLSAALLTVISREGLTNRPMLLRQKCFHVLLARYAMDTPGLAQRLAEKFNHAVTWMMADHLRKDAKRVLKQLRDRGARTGIITSGVRARRQKGIRRLGIEALIDELVLAESESLTKADPELYRRVAARSGCEAGEVLYVDDNVLTGLVAAGEAGLVTAWLRTHPEPPANGRPLPDHTVEELGDVFRIPALK